MKVILDTNVFVSGVFFSGPAYQILRAWQDAKIKLVISPEILDEYRRVGKILAADHPGVDLSAMLEFLIQNATIYSAPPLSDNVCKDPDDDMFFACALASECRIITRFASCFQLFNRVPDCFGGDRRLRLRAGIAFPLRH